MNVEITKTKVLQANLKILMETKDQLVSKIEKLKYQSYGGRRSYVFGQNIIPRSRSVKIEHTNFYFINLSYVNFMVGRLGLR